MTKNFAPERKICMPKHQYLRKDKIPGNKGAKSSVQKVILEMRVQELETNEGILEMRVQKMRRENIIFLLLKPIIVYIDSLFQFYLAITCSVCINTLHIVQEKTEIMHLFNM